MKIDDNRHQEAWKLFEDLHQHPELSWREEKTAAKVRSFLEGLGIEVKASAAKPGLLVDIEGQTPGSRVFLRGDMDALPIKEATGLAYRSTNDGVMHACGHDLHTTTLVLVADLLHRHRDQLTGSFRLAFQPAEEIQPSGAEAMIESGEADERDFFIALHSDPLIPVGRIGYRQGAINAAVDTLNIRIEGRGGHGSRPHLCLDPVRIGSTLVTELHHLVGREVSAHNPTVLTITVFQAGDAHNIIPDSATLRGTLRSYDEVTRKAMKDAIRRVCDGVGRSNHVVIHLDLQDGHSNVINDATLVQCLEDAVRATLGEEGLYRMPVPTLGGDDFACYGAKGRQLLFRLGVRGPDQAVTEDLHSPRFVADPGALRIGAEILAKVAVQAGRAIKSLN